MTTFKQMIVAGSIKRKDILRIAPADIHVEPGFNARRETPALQESIDALTAFLMQGGKVPPVEVRPRAEGGVWLVDGHRRDRAIKQAIGLGAAIEWVDAVPFEGNDLDRAVRIHTSQNGEALQPLDAALHYKTLAAFGLTADQIALRVGKSRQHVDQGLILANGPHAVHQAIDDGKVSAAVAVDLIRKHGDDAGKALDGALDDAKAQGKGKVTAGTVKGKALPAKVTDDLVNRVDGFLDALYPEVHAKLSAVKAGSADAQTMVSVNARDLSALLDAHTAIIDARADQKRRAADKAARAAQKELA